MAKLTIRDLDVRGKRVFLRVDYNVPLEEKDGQMVITDDTRIVATLPTLKLLMEKGGKLILTAHLGRPKGKRDVTMSLKPVAVKLSALLGKPVTFVDDCIGEKVERAVAAMKDGDVVLLENVRYYNEEEKNDPAFAEKLAKVADVYVNDAFGAAHRAHASTEGVARIVAKRGGKCAAGLDIGPATVKAYAAEVATAKTILWNGPMGLFENKQFAAGTNAVAQAVADATQKSGAKSIIGGGDSVKALNKAKLGDKVTFMSTGGGASLEFLEGAVLPGVAALSDK